MTIKDGTGRYSTLPGQVEQSLEVELCAEGWLFFGEKGVCANELSVSRLVHEIVSPSKCSPLIELMAVFIIGGDRGLNPMPVTKPVLSKRTNP